MMSEEPEQPEFHFLEIMAERIVGAVFDTLHELYRLIAAVAVAIFAPRDPPER